MFSQAVGLSSHGISTSSIGVSVCEVVTSVVGSGIVVVSDVGSKSGHSPMGARTLAPGPVESQHSCSVIL